MKEAGFFRDRMVQASFPPPHFLVRKNMEKVKLVKLLYLLYSIMFLYFLSVLNLYPLEFG